ncbi:MAG: gfo/Idh/MocA family oxidoreductase, partial [Planctomycetota bacterium]
MKSFYGKPLNRRRFHRTVTGLAAALTVGPHPIRARGLIERPTLLGIGVGGKGRTDLAQCAECGFDVVALCDVVDTRKLPTINDRRVRSIAQSREAFPDALFGTDYREMLDRLGDRVDAVVVSTPDHHHFFASLQAMKLGKHVYCQKPLTHGIWEARVLADAARRTGVQTQMGNQAHAADHMRRCVELIRAGVVGKVREIHA